MRTFAYERLNIDGDTVTSDGIVEMSEDEILQDYFPYWKETMVMLGREKIVTKENCLHDWINLHWGWEVKEYQ